MSVKKEATPKMHSNAKKDAEIERTGGDAGVDEAGAQCAMQNSCTSSADENASDNGSSSKDKNIDEEMQQVEGLIREAEEGTETSSVDDSEEEAESTEGEEGSAECSSDGDSAGAEADDEKASSGDARRDGDDGLSVFIKGFGCEMTESALENEMCKYGTVKGVRMPKDRKTGKGKGFAYVDFGEKKAVQKVLKLKSIMGLEVVVDKPRPMIRREKLVTVFVKNLPYECSEDAVKEYFGKFGEIHNVRMPRDDNKRVKGFAFVEVVGRGGYEKILKSTHVFEDRKLLVSECLKGGRGRSNDGGRRDGESSRRHDSEGSTKRFKRNAREEESEGDDSSEEPRERRGGARKEGHGGARRSFRERQDSNSSEFENARKNRQERDHNRGDRRNNRFDRRENDFYKKTPKDAKSSRNNKIVFDSDSD